MDFEFEEGKYRFKTYLSNLLKFYISFWVNIKISATLIYNRLLTRERIKYQPDGFSEKDDY